MVFAVYQAEAYIHVLKDNVQRQDLVLAEGQQVPAEQPLTGSSWADLQALVDRFQNRGRLARMATYDARGQALAVTLRFSPHLDTTPPGVICATKARRARG